MQKVYLLLFLFCSFLEAKYLDNASCKECHEKIYEEFQSSQHAKGYFSDELHRKIADKVSTKKYSCATCHMPMADNLQALLLGEARPDKKNRTHTDAISCYFCHTIAYVKKAHKFNINTASRQAKGYKPTLYGRLNNPDESDKHSSVTNPIYAKNVCIGCHSHKLNDNNVTIFQAMQKQDDSLSCIQCHMPEVEGGAEKLDKRARGHHASHKFLGIRDKVFRAQGVDINISINIQEKAIMITLYNKMAHPLIIQPARIKFLQVHILRKGKVIWQNFTKHPREDAKACFEYRFKGKDGNVIIIPATATGHISINNLAAHEKKTLRYTFKDLRRGDIIQARLMMRIAKEDCLLEISLKDKALSEILLLKEVEKKVD